MFTDAFAWRREVRRSEQVPGQRRRGRQHRAQGAAACPGERDPQDEHEPDGGVVGAVLHPRHGDMEHGGYDDGMTQATVYA